MSVPTSKLQGLGMTISTCVINLGSSGNCVDKAPPLGKGGEGGFKGYMKDIGLRVIRFSDKEVMGVFAILKISPIPSFPKRGLRISTGKSEEPKFLILDLSLSEAKGNVVN